MSWHGPSGNCGCCGCDDCAHCLGTVTPCCVDVTLAGFVDSDCSDCTDLNAAFTLAGSRYEASYTIGTQTREGVCIWEKCIEVCGFDRIVLVLNHTGVGGVYELVLLLIEQATGAYVEWTHLFGAGVGPTCAEWDELELSSVDPPAVSWGTGSEICWHPHFDSLPGAWPIVTATADNDCEIGCPCECVDCADGMDNCIDVTIADIVDDQCSCDCTELNGAYRLKRTGDCTFSGGLCTATRTVAYCHYHTLTVVIAEIASAYYITVTASGDTAATIVWFDYWADKPDCRNWTQLSIPYDSQTGTSYCDASGSTLELDMAAGSQVCGDDCATDDCSGRCVWCDECLDTPSFIEVDFPVFTNTDCSNCATFNSRSTYVLDYTFGGLAGLKKMSSRWSGACQWYLELPEDQCYGVAVTSPEPGMAQGFYRMAFALHKELVGGDLVYVASLVLMYNIWTAGGSWAGPIESVWRKTWLPAAWSDCQTDLITDVELNYYQTYYHGPVADDTLCVFTGTKVTINAA